MSCVQHPVYGGVLHGDSSAVGGQAEGEGRRDPRHTDQPLSTTGHIPQVSGTSCDLLPSNSVCWDFKMAAEHVQLLNVPLHDLMKF